MTLAGSYAATSNPRQGTYATSDVLLSHVTPDGEFVWNATLERAFADAPVSNPDDDPGIQVTFQVDSAVPERQNITFDGVHDIKYGDDECDSGPEDAHLGTDAERSSEHCSYSS